MKSDKLLRALLIAALAIAIGVAGYHREGLDARHLEQYLADAGILAPLYFMGAYAVATVLFIPGSVLTLLGGALFGPVPGTFYSLTGATLGAALAFLVARYAASEWVRARTGGRLGQLIEGIDGEGWRFVAFVRLVPLFPFNLVNYAFGLTRIPIAQYVVTSYLCMLPGAFAYTYLGFAGREAVAGGEGAVRNGLIALALLAAVAFVPRLVRRLRGTPGMDVGELKRQLDAGDKVLVLDVRSPEEFAGETGHIPGASNIPLASLPERFGELQAQREQPVCIVCRTDKRSAQAARLLHAHGFARLRIVRGGMIAWQKNALPVERGA
ncbi:MAG: VTT domain-containing protein [Betaproteobacteria bacterium]|nr:VTT domain-containing protein [Betaproteobacteria bacterium]